MRAYLREMKHVIGFTVILAAMLVGMTFVVAGNVAAAPAANDVALGAAVVHPPVLGSNFNRPNFNRLNFVRPAFVRPAINPFFAPAINPFFAPAINPFFAPAINPFFDDVVDFD